MKYKIKGITYEKYIIGLRKILKEFSMDWEIGESNSNETLIFSITYFDNHVEVLLEVRELVVKETQDILTSTEYDTKYAVFACFYTFLKQRFNKELSYGVLTGIRPTKLVQYYLNKNYSYEQIENIFTIKYKVSRDKARLLVEVVKNQKAILPEYYELSKEISIYLNIPFCLSRCSYCTFTNYPVNYKFVSRSEYVAILCKEIKVLGEYIQLKGINITSIYIGGGTPTALDEEDLSLLLNQVEQSLVKQSLKEYTLECGRPDSLSSRKLEIIKNSSVSRISINPETFKQETLDIVKRNHTVRDIIDQFNEARSYGFDNINMDLIFGLPTETSQDMISSVKQALYLQPESITIHSLALKKGSNLYEEQFALNDELSHVFETAYSLLKESGYLPYYLYRQKHSTNNLENIGFCKPTKESLYNIIMIEELQNILGLGCHSSSKFLNHELVLSPKDLISYVKTYDEYLDLKLDLLNKNMDVMMEEEDE